MSTAERIAWGSLGPLSFIVLIVWLRWEGPWEDQKSLPRHRKRATPIKKELINRLTRAEARSASLCCCGRSHVRDVKGKLGRKATLGRCPLWVKSRHFTTSSRCPLFPRKRTFTGAIEMSAKCQKRTSPTFRQRKTVACPDGVRQRSSLVIDYSSTSRSCLSTRRAK
jgi:hypothetical protein